MFCSWKTTKRRPTPTEVCMRSAHSELYVYYVMHQAKNRMKYVFPSPIRKVINNLFISHIS
jgi:hypothetical protein